jgi:hypothetical protein
MLGRIALLPVPTGQRDRVVESASEIGLTRRLGTLASAGGWLPLQRVFERVHSCSPVIAVLAVASGNNTKARFADLS